METMILTLSGIVATAATAFFTYIFTRRKYQAEVKEKDIGNLREIIQIWKETAKEMEAEAEKVKQTNLNLSNEIIKTHGQFIRLQKEINTIYNNCISQSCKNYKG